MLRGIKRIKSDLSAWLENETDVIYTREENSIYITLPMQYLNGEKVKMFLEIINDTVYISDLGDTVKGVYISDEKLSDLKTYLESREGIIELKDGFVLGRQRADKIIPFIAFFANALTVAEAMAVI